MAAPFPCFCGIVFLIRGMGGFSNEQLFASAATLAFLWLVFVLWKRLGKSVPGVPYLGIAGPYGRRNNSNGISRKLPSGIGEWDGYGTKAR